MKEAFYRAEESGLWQNTYANTNYMEYFAEGVQSYFNTGNLGIEDLGSESELVGPSRI